jgi:Tol biopolymer transport system component
LYETTVTHPEILTQLSPTYSASSTIAAFKYSPDGKHIVYLVDASQPGYYDIYSVAESAPGIAVKLNQALGTSLYTPYFSISPDSTTVAYAQPPLPAAALSLFLVDFTTPGMPFKVVDDIAPLNAGHPPFYIVQ